MINYGYFRHRFDAHRNRKLYALADEIGVEAYGYYYTLLEIYGERYLKIDPDEPVEIHLRLLANVWRKRVDSCKKVLTKLALSELLVVTINENTCILDIPNFLKYYGSYQKKNGKKPPNKRKENKIKENTITSVVSNDDGEEKSKPKNQKLYSAIHTAWNDMASENGLPKVEKLTETRLKKIRTALKAVKTTEEWVLLISEVPKNPWNLGQNDRKWKANFDWLFRNENYMKLLEGVNTGEVKDPLEEFFENNTAQSYDHA